NMISLERGNRQYTLITLLAWEKYQSKNEWGNSADLETKDQNAICGNSEQTEEKPLNQGNKDDEAESGNSKVTVRKQPVDINKKDKECMKKEAVVVEGEEQSADFEGVPSTRDAVPTPDKGAVPQEQISKSDYEQAIRDKYLNRRGY